MNMQPPRVVMISPSYGAQAGAEVQLKGLTRHLTNKTFIITKKTISNISKPDISEENLISLSSFLYPFLFLIEIFIWLIRNRNQYDLIHIHTTDSPAVISILSCLITKRKNIIKITRIGDNSFFDIKNKTYMGLLFYRFIMKFSDNFIAISDEIEETLLDRKIPKQKIKRINNGVDAFFSNKEFSLVSKNYLYLGRLIKRKQVDKLIIAWSKARCKSKHCKLNIVGNGPEMENLKLLVCQLKLKDSVIFHGEVKHPNVKSFFKTNGFFIQSSSSEGSSNALLEALASSMVCIANNITANTEIITDGINGFVYKNLDELINLIDNMQVISEKKIEKLIKNQKKMIAKDFSFKKISDQYSLAYSKIVSNE